MSSPMKFLTLSTDVSEPFIIANVSPLLPKLTAKDGSASPVTDAAVAVERKLSVVELN